jgi:hypothetical protein
LVVEGICGQFINVRESLSRPQSPDLPTSLRSNSLREKRVIFAPT